MPLACQCPSHTFMTCSKNNRWHEAVRIQQREMGRNVKSIVVENIQHCYQNMTTVIFENYGNNVICVINSTLPYCCSMWDKIWIFGHHKKFIIRMKFQVKLSIWHNTLFKSFCKKCHWNICAICIVQVCYHQSNAGTHVKCHR